MNPHSTRFTTFFTRLCCGLCLLWLLSACNDSDGTAAADPQAKQTVGAAGGELLSPDGSLKLTIPAGALAADTEISMVEVSAANVPAHMQPLGAQRVYRLQPAGLQFAQPVSLSVTLPAGNTIAALVLDSNGQGEAVGDSTLSFGASSRVLSGRVAHFSHLAVVPIQSATLDIAVDDRSVRVGDLLRANVKLNKGAGDSFRAFAPGEIRLGKNFTLVAGSSFPVEASAVSGPNEIFAEGQSRELVSAFTARCDAPGNAVISFRLLLADALALRMRAAYGAASLDGAVRVLEVVTDVVCDPAGSQFDAIRIGIFSMPFGTGPDGISAVRGAFTNLPDTGAPRLGISTALGYVLIDPLTGLVDLNLTEGSLSGSLGRNLLGALAVSANPRGPSANAALVGFGLSNYSALNWDPTAGAFGLRLLYPDGVLDAQHVGGDTEAPRLILSSPTRGISFVGPNPNGFFVAEPFQSGTLITPTQLGGQPRSAAQPFGSADPLIVAAVVPIGGGAQRNEVIALTPGGLALGKLLELAGTPAYALRCLQYGALPTMLVTLQQLAVCGVTQGDAVHLFTVDKTNPTAVPVVQKIDSPGALGLEWSIRANGLPSAVVANYAANNFTYVDVAADGSTTTRTEPAPADCKKPAHAVQFAHGDRDYVAFTCNESNHYGVVRRTFSF